MTTPWPDRDYQPSDYSDLDSFANDYRPQHAIKSGIDTLANGPYDFEILGAALDRINADRIVRINLRVVGGAEVEWLQWLTRQESLNSLCANLGALGFDVDKWGAAHKRPLSIEIPQAIAKLAGIKFRGHKSSREDKRPGKEGTWYHDLRVTSRIDARPMPPLTGPAGPAASPSPASPPSSSRNHTTPVGAGASAVPDDDTPF